MMIIYPQYVVNKNNFWNDARFHYFDKFSYNGCSIILNAIPHAKQFDPKDAMKKAV